MFPLNHLSSLLAVPAEDGVCLPWVLLLSCTPSETGSAQKGEEAALNTAFAELSVSGMKKHL